MEHGDQVGACGLRGESGAPSEQPSPGLFKNLGLKTGSAGSRVPFAGMDWRVALCPGRVECVQERRTFTPIRQECAQPPLMLKNLLNKSSGLEVARTPQGDPTPGAAK